jgi:hypothetical protein
MSKDFGRRCELVEASTNAQIELPTRPVAREFWFCACSRLSVCTWSRETMNQQTGATVIRIDRRTRTIITGFWCVIVGVVAASTILSLTEGSHKVNAPSKLAVSLGMMIFGAANILGVLRSRVVLHPEGIQVRRCLLPSRRVERIEIVARRTSRAGWRRPPCHVLITRGGNEIKLPPYLQHSAVLQNWLKSIPLESRNRVCA